MTLRANSLTIKRRSFLKKQGLNDNIVYNNDRDLRKILHEEIRSGMTEEYILEKYMSRINYLKECKVKLDKKIKDEERQQIIKQIKEEIIITEPTKIKETVFKEKIIITEPTKTKETVFKEVKIKTSPDNLYLIRAVGTNFVKIGVTCDIEQRLRTLQTGNMYKLEVIMLKNVGVKAYGIENRVHKMYDYCNMQGEWFDINDVELLYNRIEEMI